MRSFQQLVVLLFATLFAFALAQDASYDATVYVTSTVYRVNTVTLSGTPTGSVGNTTSTIYPSIPSQVAPVYPSGNGTTVAPTATGTGAPSTSSPVDFPGAASTLNINAAVAAMAALVGYLAL